MKRQQRIMLTLSILLLAVSVSGRSIQDIEFATVDGHDLFLDLLLPDNAANPPLIVWVHGGAWRKGSRKNIAIREMTSLGWAIASVDYRLSPVAPFPAQVHDIKAAIRFLRANAGDFGYDPKRIIIAGSSAGGHLAALVGVTNNHPELEGKVGEFDATSSSVSAIISFFGASNLTTILDQSTPHGLNVRVPALNLLLGGPPEEQTELARLASPVLHVDRSDPPLFLLHGDQDPQMPINQAHELHGRYKQAGLRVRFDVIHGAAHGGPAFFNEEVFDSVDAFLRKN